MSLTKRQRAILAVANAIREAKEAIHTAEEQYDELMEAVYDESAEDLPFAVGTALSKKGWGQQARELADIFSDVEREKAAEDV